MKCSLGDFFIFISLLSLIIASLGFPSFKYIFVLIESVFFAVSTNKVFKKSALIFIFIFCLTGLRYYTTIIFTISSLLYAKRVFKMKIKSFYLLVNIIIYAYCLIILYFAFNGYNPNSIINASRNHLAVPLIALGSLKLFLIARFKFNPSMISSSLIFIVALWSISRGSIISSAILFILSAYQLTENGSLLKNILLPIFLGVFIYSNYSTIKKYTYSKSFSFEKFSDNRNSIKDDPRAELIDEYINAINLKSFILGGPMYSSAHNNYHNSYISAHAMFGLSFVIFFTYFVLKLGVYVLYLIPLLARSITDTILFMNGEFDFIIFLVIILSLQKKYETNILYNKVN